MITPKMDPMPASRASPTVKIANLDAITVYTVQADGAWQGPDYDKW